MGVTPGSRERLPGGAHRAAEPGSKLDSGNSEGAGPPGACPFDFLRGYPAASSTGSRPRDVCEPAPAAIYITVYRRQGGKHMPMWVWILIIVLLVLLLFGGVGYGRRGTRV